MATCKALKLIVELDINTVTCPGVWLPDKGEVLVRLWMLDATSRTTSILPVFPLVYHENFLFEKVFACQRLPDLHARLADETVRVELQQLRNGHVTPLANFECSLLTLLFPEVDRPGLQCTEEVSLCMQPLFLFPGVLPPKLELSTRTLIEEASRNTSRKSCIRKTISSQSRGVSSRSPRNVRQLARQAHSHRTPSPPCPESPRRERPPFVVRHVREDIFKLPPPCKRRERAKSPCSCDVRYYRCLADTDDEEGEDFTPRSSHAKSCSADEACRHHCGRVCTVCKLYQAYFGSTYPAHHNHASTDHVTFADDKPRCQCKVEIVSEPTSPHVCACGVKPISQRGVDTNIARDTSPHGCDDAEECASDVEREEERQCQCWREKESRICDCQDDEISCTCETHSLSEWCRRKRTETRCPLLMNRIKDSY